MARKSQSIRSAGQSANDRIEQKVLTADLSSYPGDIIQFDDDKLDENLLSQVKALEERLANEPAFSMLERGLDQLRLRPADRRLLYRWFCLICWQNKLCSNQIREAAAKVQSLSKHNAKLLEDAYQGTAGFLDKAIRQGKGLGWIEEQLEILQRQWREKKLIEIAELRKRQALERERRRRRSGRPVAAPKAIDWTQAHTAQEYVEAFCNKAVHTKRVREFLRDRGFFPQRRGRGRSAPFEYPFEASLALFEQVVTGWLGDPHAAIGMVRMTAFDQVNRSTALSREGLQFREMLMKFVRNLPEVLQAPIWFVKTEQDWACMHSGARNPKTAE